MNAFLDINWIAVAIATLAFGVLGAIYFAALVPKQYAVALGHEPGFRPKQSALTGAGPLISALVIVVASAALISALDVQTVGGALLFGLLVAVGFLIPQTLTIAINPNFPHPIRYALLNAPYFVVGSLVAATVLTLLR